MGTLNIKWLIGSFINDWKILQFLQLYNIILKKNFNVNQNKAQSIH